MTTDFIEKIIEDPKIVFGHGYACASALLDDLNE